MSRRRTARETKYESSAMSAVADIWKTSEMMLVALKSWSNRVSVTTPASFPFDRRGRLARDVVDHAVDARYFVDDARRDSLQDVIIQPRPVGGHAVFARYRPNGNHVCVRPAVAHDADALQRRQHREVLPRLFAGTAGDFFARDRVGAAQDGQALIGDLAQHTNGEAGAREGLARNDRVGQAELAAQGAHFVFEQKAQ